MQIPWNWICLIYGPREDVAKFLLKLQCEDVSLHLKFEPRGEIAEWTVAGKPERKKSDCKMIREMLDAGYVKATSINCNLSLIEITPVGLKAIEKQLDHLQRHWALNKEASA